MPESGGKSERRSSLRVSLIYIGPDICRAPALTFAATFGHIEIAELLLKNGALTNLKDARGKTSLDHAVIQENEAMVELLISYATLQNNEQSEE